MAKAKKKTRSAPKRATTPQMVWTGVGQNNLVFGRDKKSQIFMWDFFVGGWVLCAETEAQAKLRIQEDQKRQAAFEKSMLDKSAEYNRGAEGDHPLARVAQQTKRTPVAQDNVGAAEGGEFKLAKRVADPLG